MDKSKIPGFGVGIQTPEVIVTLTLTFCYDYGKSLTNISCCISSQSSPSHHWSGGEGDDVTGKEERDSSNRKSYSCSAAIMLILFTHGTLNKRCQNVCTAVVCFTLFIHIWPNIISGESETEMDRGPHLTSQTAHKLKES